jgi:pimeloyl-ACP methyl ester carboxylesterase
MNHQKVLGILLVVLLVFFGLLGQASADTVKLENGITLNYRTAGDGLIPIIFVHGYSFSADVWEKVFERLPRRYKAYAYDLRGFGESSKPDSGYAYADFVNDLALFMNSMKIPKAIFVGHSLGAIFLQDFAVKYPDRVLALVLSNTQARNKDFGGKVPPSIAKRIAAYGNREANQAIFEKSTPRYFKPGNLSEADKTRFIQINLMSATPALRESFEVIFTTLAIPPEQFARITAPTLVVVSTHDIVKFPVAITLSEGIPHCEICVVERAGHTPMWEQPDRFCQGVFSFLDHSL